MRYRLLPTLALLVCGLAIVPSSSSAADGVKAKSLSTTGSKFPATVAAKSTPRIVDCIRNGGELHGVLLDRNGKAAMGINLQLHNARGERRYAKSDSSGRFAFKAVGTGVYALQGELQTTPHGLSRNTLLQWVRIWNASTAPPVAKAQLLAVVDKSVIRGQCCANAGISPSCSQCGDCMDCCGGCGGSRFGVGRLIQAALDNPWMVAAGTAAAIAIPIAANDDDTRPGDDIDVVASEDSPSGEADDGLEIGADLSDAS